MISNCYTLTFSLHIPVLSSGLNWIPPIVTQLVAIEYKKLSTLLFWGVGDRTAGESKRGEATTTACMFGRGSALRMTFESFFFFYFSENFTNSTNSKLARLDHFNFEAFSTFARTGTYSSYFVTRPFLTRYFKMVEKINVELCWCSLLIQPVFVLGCQLSIWYCFLANKGDITLRCGYNFPQQTLQVCLW